MSCPTWEERARHASAYPKRVSIFCFGYDAGPDNTGSTRRIRSKLVGINTVLLCVTWCFMHQCQLALKSIIAAVDKFEASLASGWGETSK